MEENVQKELIPKRSEQKNQKQEAKMKRMMLQKLEEKQEKCTKGFMRALLWSRRKGSVRKILQEFSMQKKDIGDKPLKDVTEDETTAIILRWILDRLPAEKAVTIRARDIGGDVFSIRMRNHHRAIYATSIQRLQKTRKLYYWKKNVTYDDLTIEKIEKSIDRTKRNGKKKKGKKIKQEKTIAKEKDNFSNKTGNSGSEWDPKIWERIGLVDPRTLGNQENGYRKEKPKEPSYIIVPKIVLKREM